MVEHKEETLWIRLQQEPLRIEPVMAFLQHPRAGGIDIFAGTTRQWTGEDETTELAYECYEPLAINEMKRLAQVAMTQWPAIRVCIWHRLGVVPIAETSVVVGVATPHRADAFEACRYLIDTLKIQVPIWKKEHYADGRTEWVEGASAPSIPNEDKPAD